MRRTTRWLAPALAAAALALTRPAAAQTGLYLRTDIGFGIAPALTVDGSDNDWGTKCDRIINPNGVEVTNECDSAPPRSSWKTALGGGRGALAGLAAGFDLGALRFEAEYLTRVTAYNDEADLGILDDVTADKQEQEIELAVGGVDDLQSHGALANVYLDLGGAGSPWTAYVGGGAGIEWASLVYYTHWKRNDDPSRIKTFADPALSAKLAGTTTIGRARLRDAGLAYQVLAGAEYKVRDDLALGVRLRWLPPRTFESDPTPWNQLRSHESTVGRGGQVLYIATTDDNALWAASFTARYSL